MGGDHDGLTGVDAHWVDVFHGAHYDGIVSAIAHHLILMFLPTEDTHLDEYLPYRRVQDALTRYLDQFACIVSSATP